MQRLGVEAVVERDIAGERVIDPLLRLDRDDAAPPGHVARPLDGVNADIGAAIDDPHAVAKQPAALVEEKRAEIDLFRLECGKFQRLRADAIEIAVGQPVFVETVEDQRPVARRSEDERDPLP